MKLLELFRVNSDLNVYQRGIGTIKLKAIRIQDSPRTIALIFEMLRGSRFEYTNMRYSKLVGVIDSL